MKQRKLMRKVKPGEHRLTFSVLDEEYAARQNARDMGFDSPEKRAAFAFRFPVRDLKHTGDEQERIHGVRFADPADCSSCGRVINGIFSYNGFDFYILEHKWIVAQS